MNVLKNKRILICGKGGSGKSSIVSLLGNELAKQKYKVILLDADASNPGGLFLLLGNRNVFAILNKVDSEKTDIVMRNSLKKRGVGHLGSISYDKKIYKAGFEGKMISHCKAERQIAEIVKNLEEILK